ncbi:MAG: hypothetical protein IPM25_03585 [Chloracidobacterium sp.]|nr:hypothetical protein [Chloracidobacterium sp.]
MNGETASRSFNGWNDAGQERDPVSRDEHGHARCLCADPVVAAVQDRRQGPCRNEPSADVFVAASRAALARGTSYTLLVHDNYPEILVAAGKIRESSLTAKFFSFFNRWLYKHASGIVVVGRDMAELLERKTAGLSIPIQNIPNWAELETVSPRPREENSLLAELGLFGKFVLLYAGNMGPNDVDNHRSR